MLMIFIFKRLWFPERNFDEKNKISCSKYLLLNRFFDGGTSKDYTKV